MTKSIYYKTYDCSLMANPNTAIIIDKISLAEDVRIILWAPTNMLVMETKVGETDGTTSRVQF